MDKFLSIVLNFVVYFSLIFALETEIIQRKIDFLKTDISTVMTKWFEKMETLESYNEYVSCWRNTSATGEYVDTKHITETLDKLKTKAKIELMFYRRIIDKLTEIFPREILMVNQRDPDVSYQAEEMKLAFTESVEPFTDFQVPGPDFLYSSEGTLTTCPNDVLETRKFTLTSRLEFCSSYPSCNNGYFTVLSTGNIVFYHQKFIEMFSMNGTQVKGFKSNLPGMYTGGITFWKENKILVLQESDDEDGDIYVVDVATETTEFYHQAWPYDYSAGISVFDDVILTCSGNGLLFRIDKQNSKSRGRMHRYDDPFYDKVYIYESGPGSRYGLLNGELFHHQYVLMKSNGEIVCSPKVDKHPTFMAKAAVGKDFFVISSHDFKGFQAYDLECNPLGEAVRFEHGDMHNIIDMNILNNTVIVRSSNSDMIE
ncbi:hypothetical protein KUTeg_011287 [Tegillarca granosa]|uniref:Uncharacterized protein n=1 Tax=Tegillarca granosa TaxID=220873 RepID=A0ABQ9F188_TEGGR|nr:hypothetical protein KUTeg_011287 [Tegillarca granosa]